MIDENDLKYEHIHSNIEDYGLVNPTVILTHLPTGLQVECDFERSLMYNRKIAFGMLCEKLKN